MALAASPVPLYHRIASLLRARIHDEVYRPGIALPSEEELGAEFGVSRATIRLAVGELVQSGLVRRRRGSGTFVLPTATKRIGQRFHGALTDLISTESRQAQIQNVEICHQHTLPSRVADLLKLDTPVGTIIKRTRTIDGRELCYSLNYLPDEVGMLLSEDELCSESLLWLLTTKGVQLSGIRQTIRAELADLQSSERLGIEFGMPVLWVDRLVFIHEAQPIGFFRTCYRGDLYEYKVTFDLLSHPIDNIDADLG